MKTSWPKGEELFDAVMVKLVRSLPISWASWLGGELGALQGRKALKGANLSVLRLRANIARFSGVTDPAELDQRVIAFCRLTGRIYAEIPNLQRLYAAGRVEVVGEENLVAAGKPCIIVGSHVANWEMLGAVAYRVNGLSVLYSPIRNAFRLDIVLAARLAWPDVEMIPKSPAVALRLDRALKKGRNLVILVDEIGLGYVRGPSLGRSLPYAGNRWLAARLAARNDVNLVPVFVECLGFARYRVVVQSPLERPNGMGGATLERHLADQIDRRLEAWVLPRIETWHCLPNFDPEVAAPTDT
jgi:lauroyl/myristoyl acyltransferase